jgi:hypothetical protein
MTDQERLRRVQEQANSYVSRNRCVDASLMTMMNQAKAAKGGPAAPQTVAGKKIVDGCCRDYVATGKGTNMDQTALLQKAQGCAICPDGRPADSTIPAGIVLPVPCIDNFAPPFTQQNLSTMYVAPCVDPGNRVYFPDVVKRGEDCTLEHLPYDS